MQIHTRDPVERNSTLSVLWESKATNEDQPGPEKSHGVYEKKDTSVDYWKDSLLSGYGQRDVWFWTMWGVGTGKECSKYGGMSVKEKSAELREYIISHAKWARFWMALNVRPGECWIWWCFKNTNPQWVFSSVLYSRCYLLYKTTTATHTFSTEFPLQTLPLYIYLFKLGDYKRKRSL